MISLYFFWGCVYAKRNGLDNGTMTSHCNAVFYFSFIISIFPFSHHSKEIELICIFFRLSSKDTFKRSLLYKKKKEKPILHPIIIIFIMKSILHEVSNKTNWVAFDMRKLTFTSKLFYNISHLLTHSHTLETTLTDVTI